MNYHSGMSSPRNERIVPIVVSTPGSPAPRPGAGRVGDVALSVALLIAGYVAYFVGAIFALLTVGITDARGGASAVLVVGIALAVTGLAATIATVVLQRMRRRTRWIAAGNLLLTIVGWIVAFVLYVVSLG